MEGVFLPSILLRRGSDHDVLSLRSYLFYYILSEREYTDDSMGFFCSMVLNAGA